jgi:hypothetical protein
MAFVPYNPNPKGTLTGDCAIRAVAKATDMPWENAYTALTVEGYKKGDLPNANHVWGAYLKSKGFKREIIPDTCPDCYTVRDFAEDHPKGMYVLALDNHVVTVFDGDYFDAWDSGQEIPLYYWYKEDSY